MGAQCSCIRPIHRKRRVQSLPPETVERDRNDQEEKSESINQGERKKKKHKDHKQKKKKQRHGRSQEDIPTGNGELFLPNIENKKHRKNKMTTEFLKKTKNNINNVDLSNKAISLLEPKFRRCETKNHITRQEFQKLLVQNAEAKLLFGKKNKKHQLPRLNLDEVDSPMKSAQTPDSQADPPNTNYRSPKLSPHKSFFESRAKSGEQFQCNRKPFQSKTILSNSTTDGTISQQHFFKNCSSIRSQFPSELRKPYKFATNQLNSTPFSPHDSPHLSPPLSPQLPPLPSLHSHKSQKSHQSHKAHKSHKSHKSHKRHKTHRGYKTQKAEKEGNTDKHSFGMLHHITTTNLFTTHHSERKQTAGSNQGTPTPLQGYFTYTSNPHSPNKITNLSSLKNRIPSSIPNTRNNCNINTSKFDESSFSSRHSQLSNLFHMQSDSAYNMNALAKYKKSFFEADEFEKPSSRFSKEPSQLQHYTSISKKDQKENSTKKTLLETFFPDPEDKQMNRHSQGESNNIGKASLTPNGLNGIDASRDISLDPKYTALSPVDRFQAKYKKKKKKDKEKNRDSFLHSSTNKDLKSNADSGYLSRASSVISQDFSKSILNSQISEMGDSVNKSKRDTNDKKKKESKKYLKPGSKGVGQRRASVWIPGTPEVRAERKRIWKGEKGTFEKKQLEDYFHKYNVRRIRDDET